VLTRGDIAPREVINGLARFGTNGVRVKDGDVGGLPCGNETPVRVWTEGRTVREHLAGVGHGCRHVCLIWRWSPVFRHCVGGGKRADALRRHSRARPCDLPFCRQGSLRSIAASTQKAVITRLRRPLKLAAVSPPIAPARARQETFDWAASAHEVARGLRDDVRAAAEVCFDRTAPLNGCPPV
jgi:hypothetical protein